MNKDEILQKLKTGELLPDQVFGWSTKTILAGMLAYLLIRAKLSL